MDSFLLFCLSLTVSSGLRCPGRPFPVVVGASDGDTVYLSVQTDDTYFYVGGYSTSDVFINPSESKSAIYHVYNFETFTWVSQKYFTTTYFDEIHHISYSSGYYYGVTGYPGYLLASNEASGANFKVL